MKTVSDNSYTINESSKSAHADFELSALKHPLKIGYDGKRAANNLTGLGNYSRSLIQQLALKFPENQYLVYTPKVKSARQIDTFFETKNIFLNLPKSSKFLWRSFGILKDLKKDKLDIFHGLSHEIPFRIQKTAIKSVLTMHDLIFLRFPHYYKFIDRSLYTFKSKYACKHADQIIAISEKTKADIIEFYNIHPDKIQVIYQSCDDSFKTAFSTERLSGIREKYQLPENYILNVGTIEERKNLKLLVQALKHVDPQYKLVVIGKKTPYFKIVEQEIEKLGLMDRILFLKDIPFSDLPGIYQLAKLFAYPSFYEGFGIPIIEALYSGVPTVAATGSCLEEAGGPDSIYIDPNDALALANALNKIIQSPQLQKEMHEKGLDFVQKFNSHVVTEQMMNCYKKLKDQNKG
ncbi:glycosyltransferase family 4 protein [Pedobacter sp. MW01-1-1]|uniref:glycosyltransferase family 4 protein n=1 Tax=Pedobacter sp. MW01-1-1 TaxID=3383027 RepID=UPI003FF107CF